LPRCHKTSIVTWISIKSPVIKRLRMMSSPVKLWMSRWLQR